MLWQVMYTAARTRSIQSTLSRFVGSLHAKVIPLVIRTWTDLVAQRAHSGTHDRSRPPQLRTDCNCFNPSQDIRASLYVNTDQLNR